MRYLLCLIITILTGCANLCAHTDFVLKQGICVNRGTSNIKQSDMETVIDLIISELPKMVNDERYTQESLTQVFYGQEIAIVFREHVIHDGKKKKGTCRYNFYNDNSMDFLINLKSYECIGDTSLIHELLHVILISIDEDVSHRDNWFTVNPFVDQSYQNVLDNMVLNELCKGE